MQNARYYMIPFMGHSGKSKTTEMENRSVLARCLDGGVSLQRGSLCRIFGGELGVETTMYLDCGGGHMAPCTCPNSQNCSPKTMNFTE